MKTYIKIYEIITNLQYLVLMNNVFCSKSTALLYLHYEIIYVKVLNIIKKILNIYKL